MAGACIAIPTSHEYVREEFLQHALETMANMFRGEALTITPGGSDGDYFRGKVKTSVGNLTVGFTTRASTSKTRNYLLTGTRLYIQGITSAGRSLPELMTALRELEHSYKTDA